MSRSILSLLVAVTVVVAQQPARTIRFHNSCPRDVWISGTSGATGSCASGCPAGSTCNTDNGICFFNVPRPTSGNWRVPRGGENFITFPPTANNLGAVWSGNFNFCAQGTICTHNGQFVNDTICDQQGCSPYAIGTLAEITMSKTGVDFYDISLIGGISTPVSFGPEITNRAADPYWCANLGGITSNTGLGNSSWTFPDAPAKFRYVVPSSPQKTCNSDGDCGGLKCGLFLDQNDHVTFRQVCGTHAGYWTQGAICGANGNTNVVPCAQSVQNGPFATTIRQLQGCTGDAVSGSCYSNGADTHCCGCADWQDVFGTNVVPASTTRCANKNPLWVGQIQPTIQWLKKGAPNSYTFPYDDMSSTSTCSNINGQWNTQNYVIEICPGGRYWS